MRILILIVLALSLSACVRPTGDFGRARTSIVHDEVLPTVGKLRALIFKEPLSGFNWTDQEKEMHDRAWRFLIAPHARSWFLNVLVEWQRTRIAPRIDTSQTYDRYYKILRLERYRSSRVRYNKVISDLDADIATIPGVMKAICAVEDVDRQRDVASRSLQGLDPAKRADVAARRAENQNYIDWFVASVQYRYAAYSYALENLLVETPHEEARVLDARLSVYASWVERAKARNFCAGPLNVYGGAGQSSAPASRMHSKPFTPDPNFRK
jgi:hypothetical protein